MNEELKIGQTVFVTDGTKITSYKIDEIRNFITAAGKEQHVFADAKGNRRELHLVGFHLTEAAARQFIKDKAKKVYDMTCKEADETPLDNSFL